MASIQRIVTERGEVTYRAQIRRKGFPARSATFRELRLARDWAKKIEAQMIEGRHGLTAIGRRKTVSDAIDRFVSEVLPTPRYRDKKNPRTRLDWWKAEIGGLLLDEVTPDLVDEKIHKLLSQPYTRARPGAPNSELAPGEKPRTYRRSHKTANRYVAALSKVFKLARRPWRWTVNNPFAGVEKAPEGRGRVRIFVGDEQARLLEQTEKDHQLHTLVHVALSTAPRAGELTKLRWQDIDLEALGNDQETAVRALLRETKNSEPRTAWLIGEALRLMRGHWALAGWPAKGLVFTSKTGKVYRYHKPFVAAVTAAGLEDFHFHDLRHCSATWLAREGATEQQLKAVGGWKSNVVARYVHLAQQDALGILQKMNEAHLTGHKT